MKLFKDKIFKTLCIILIIFSISGCHKENKDNDDDIEIKYTFDIECKNVDMSKYEGISSTKHKFKEINIDDLFRTIDEKSSGIFFIGGEDCHCCQNITRYLSEVANELDTTIFYIDKFADNGRLLIDEDLQQKLIDYLYDILDFDEEGEKALQTPTLFTVINGEITDSQICINNILSKWSNPPTQKEIDRLKLRYSTILKPFSSQSQD